MQDFWYADKRDLVKWGVLLHLASRFGAADVIQVAYYRPGTWPSLNVGGRRVEMPGEVVGHFRNLRQVKKMTKKIRIDVLDRKFVNRDSYSKWLLRRLSKRKGGPAVIFLDPDTGLEPRKPRLNHVLESEVKNVWAALQVGDVLALYQHKTNRTGKPWVQPKRRQFAGAINVPPGAIGIGWGPKVVKDAVILYCQKEAEDLRRR